MKTVTTASIKVLNHINGTSVTVVIAIDLINVFWAIMQGHGIIMSIETIHLMDGSIIPVFPFTLWNGKLNCHQFKRLEDSSGTTWWSSDQDA